MKYSFLVVSPGLVVREEYVFKSNALKVRTHISCKAALVLLFTTSSALQGEETTAAIKLRCQLIDILVNAATTQREHPAVSTIEPACAFHSPPSESSDRPAAEPLNPLLMSTPISAMPSELTSVSEENIATPLDSSVLTAIPVTPSCDQEQLASNSVNNTAPMSKCIATEDLLSRQQNMRQQQDKGRKFTSREVARRLNLQRDELTKIAKNVHHGSKNDFIASLAESVTNCDKEDDGDNNWDGTLSPQDVVNLAKKAHDPKTRKPIYDIIITQEAANHHHLSAIEVLNLQDTTNPTEMIGTLRRKLPGFFYSERKVNNLKAKLRREFEVIWRPERTHSCWRINPDRLRETLLYLYWWLPSSEWWKMYGDGRNFGGKDSVAVTMNVLNNEAMFHGISYHSPDEHWPLYIFLWKGH